MSILWFMAILVASINAEPFVGHGHSHGQKDVDPHGKNICWDVSVYNKVEFSQQKCEKCFPRLEKVKYDRKHRVCQNVTRQECSIVGYTECEVRMTPKPYKTQAGGYDYFQTHDCIDRPMKVKHNKTRPVCAPVTKQNCVTKWEMLPNGTKVWTGNEDCKPVTWEECKEEWYEVDFIKDTVVCVPDIKIPHCQCRPIEKEMMTLDYVCIPKSSLECKSVTSQICTDVIWQDVHQEVVNDCYPDMVWVPSQDKSHEKRCLLDPDTDGRVPKAPPIGPTYPAPNPRKPTYTKPTTGPVYGVPLAPVYTGTG